MFDLIIKNGLVIDGSGKPGRTADVAIAGDRIKGVGAFPAEQAYQVIDADQKVVAPGFIDIHSHSDFTLLADPQADGKIRQGITTELIGLCGLSGAPMLGDFRERRAEELASRGISLTWSNLTEYFACLEEARPADNVATLVGHGNLRGGIIGYGDRPALDEELRQMASLLVQSLEMGAFGLSTGLIYPPGVYSSSKELETLTTIVADQGGIYATHLRSEGDYLEEALTEAIFLVEETGVSLQISHLKTYGRRNWLKLPAAFRIIENARSRGLSVHADRYPYTASFTDLDVLLPAWAWEGGKARTLERLADPAMRQRMTDEILALHAEPDWWKHVIVASVRGEKNRSYSGRSLAEIAVDHEQYPWTVLYDILQEEELDATAFFFAMSEENLEKILAKEYVMIGTDSAVRSLSGTSEKGKPHPRCFGTYPRVLAHWTGRGKLLSWEQAIHKMTGMPAAKLGLTDRGYVQPNCYADLVIIDPATICDLADYQNPFQAPVGIEHVIVNGERVLSEGELTGRRPGRVLYKS